jgi:hypothetical protein
MAASYPSVYANDDAALCTEIETVPPVLTATGSSTMAPSVSDTSHGHLTETDSRPTRCIIIGYRELVSQRANDPGLSIADVARTNRLVPRSPQRSRIHSLPKGGRQGKVIFQKQQQPPQTTYTNSNSKLGRWNVPGRSENLAARIVEAPDALKENA